MIKRSLFLMVGILIFQTTAYAEMYRWEDENGGVHFSDRPPPESSTAARPLAPAPLQPPPQPTASATPPSSVPTLLPSQNVSPIPQIRAMLREGRFEALNTLLEERRAAAVKDIRREDDLAAAYEAFDVNDGSYEPLLDRWVASFPQSHQPYLARAQYLYAMAGKARGTRWVSETSDRQLEAMRAYHSRAATDIKTTLQIQERNVIPYRILLGMIKTSNQDEFARRVLAKALEFCPASYQLRATYLHGLTPRWGGSYELMAAFIEESKKQIASNPKLAALAGFIAYDTGDLQYAKKNYVEAEELLTKALSYGDLGMFYLTRARIRLGLKKYDQALQDINRGIGLWPHDGDYYHIRSRILVELKRTDEALRDIETANLLTPNDEAIGEFKKWLSNQLEIAGYRLQQNMDAKGAVGAYSAAIRADPNSGPSYLRRARVLADQNRPDDALADLERARQLDPNEIDIYLTVDSILMKRQDWDRIIRSWDQFIALNPGNGRAYLERGGAYFHKGDMKSSLKDAKKAADLGNAEGQRLYERFKDSAGQ